MPRSDYIYVVLIEVFGCRIPIAAFTIKCELVHWLHQQKYPKAFFMYRLSNNDPSHFHVKLDAEELLK